MVHKGSSGGKRWRLVVFEKFGSAEAKVFSSKRDRPRRVVDSLEGWLFRHPTFDYELHAINVVHNWFSVKGIGAGLRKIGGLFNQPLFGKVEDE